MYTYLTDSHIIHSYNYTFYNYVKCVIFISCYSNAQNYVVHAAEPSALPIQKYYYTAC